MPRTAANRLSASHLVEVSRRWRHILAPQRKPAAAALFDDVRRRHPRFATAVKADLRLVARSWGEGGRWSRAETVGKVLRLCLVTDGLLALCCYRAKASCQAQGIPLLPRIFHRLAMATGQLAIGDPVVVGPGILIGHGQVVIDGFVTVGSGTVFRPFVTLGRNGTSLHGPTIEPDVRIGTGAKVLGPITIGRGAEIGANAVVLQDVPAGARAVGVPARILPPAAEQA